MTAVAWLILCVLGLALGFVVGWGQRARRGDDMAEPEPTIAEPAPVIDLRAIPSPQPPTEAEEPEPELEPAPAAALAVAGSDRDHAAVTGGPDAQIIDLRRATTPPVPVHNLQFIAGIGPRLDKRFRRHGITTVAELATLDEAQVRAILRELDDQASTKRARKIKQRAADRLADAAEARTAPDDLGHDLRRIDGIGTTMMRWLETQGITTLEQLATLRRAEVTALEQRLTDYPGRITREGWRKQARALLTPTGED